MGDDATLLLGSVPSSGEEVCKGHLKERGGPWEFPHAHNLFGRECGSTILCNIFFVVLVVKYNTEWGPLYVDVKMEGATVWNDKLG